MGENYREKSNECFTRADYDGCVRYAKMQYQETQSEDDRKLYEKARADHELYREMQQIINADPEDYYSLLGVTGAASVSDIKKAFRKLAFKYHPNKTRVEGATAAMRVIQKAYFEINTEEKKAAYDRRRMGFAHAVPGHSAHSSGDTSYEQEMFRAFTHRPGFSFQMHTHPFYNSQIINELFNDPYSTGEMYRMFYRQAARRNNTRNAHLWELGIACLIQLIIIYIAFSCLF